MQEYQGDKLGILDVKLKLKSGKIINIEVQVDSAPFMESRVLFYVSKMVTEQIKESDPYDKIKQVVSIIITGHSLIERSDKYHHRFGLYDIESGVLLTDNLEIHTLEIPKARKVRDDSETNQLLNWMKFFDAKTEEELKMLAQTSPAMKKATVRLMELSADEKARQLYEARLMHQMDIDVRQRWAIKSREIEFAKKLLQRNRPIEEIIEDTGLSQDEIEALRTAN